MFIDNVYIIYHTECIITHSDGNGPYDFKYRKLTFNPIECVRKNPNRLYCKSIPVNFAPTIGKEFWLVVVRYSDGDSFGQVDGCADIICGLRDEDDALELKRIIMEGAQSTLPNAIKYNAWFDEQMGELVNKPNEYASWTGYFSKLEDVEIHKIPVGI